MRALRWLRPLLLLVIVGMALLSLRETSAVTACQARGGEYDRFWRRCDAASFQQRPVFRPFVRRREVLAGAALVALMGAGVAVWLCRRAVRARGN